MSKVPAATHTLAILRLLMTTDAPISAAGSPPNYGYPDPPPTSC